MALWKHRYLRGHNFNCVIITPRGWYWYMDVDFIEVGEPRWAYISWWHLTPDEVNHIISHSEVVLTPSRESAEELARYIADADATKLKKWGYVIPLVLSNYKERLKGFLRKR